MNKHFTWLAPTAVICSAASIFAAQYLTIDQAKSVCFPQATRWEEKKTTLTKAKSIWIAYDKESCLGYLITDSVIGKHDWIDFAVAIDTTGHVKQVEIMIYREAYGSDVKKENWRNQFKDKSLSDSLTLGKDIKNITGATLSSRHVTEGVKHVLAVYDAVFKK